MRIFQAIELCTIFQLKTTAINPAEACPFFSETRPDALDLHLRGSLSEMVIQHRRFPHNFLSPGQAKQCPEGYTAVDNWCFHYSTQSTMNWYNGSLYCNNLNPSGQLVDLSDQTNAKEFALRNYIKYGTNIPLLRYSGFRRWFPKFAE